MTDIQANVLLRQRGRAAADAFERDVIVPTRFGRPIARPPNYGRVIAIGQEQPW